MASYKCYGPRIMRRWVIKWDDDAMCDGHFVASCDDDGERVTRNGVDARAEPYGACVSWGMGIFCTSIK